MPSSSPRTPRSCSGGSRTGFFVAGEIALAVFLGALSILALRRVVLPQWLGWFGVVVTVLLLIPPIGWAALLFLLPVWLIATSVILRRRSGFVSEPHAA
jgi:hypothetical protein